MKHVLHTAVHQIITAVLQVYLQPFYNSLFMASLKLGFLWINMAENGFAQYLVKSLNNFKINR
jgi:hypothetical protein